MKHDSYCMKYATHLRFILTKQIADVLGYGQACVLFEVVM